MQLQAKEVCRVPGVVDSFSYVEYAVYLLLWQEGLYVRIQTDVKSDPSWGQTRDIPISRITKHL